MFSLVSLADTAAGIVSGCKYLASPRFRYHAAYKDTSETTVSDEDYKITPVKAPDSLSARYDQEMLQLHPKVMMKHAPTKHDITPRTRLIITEQS